MISWGKFVELAKNEFHFLGSSFGFFCEPDPKPPFVTFYSEKIILQLFYDVNGRGELDLGIKKSSDVKSCCPSFGIYEFKKLTGIQDSSLAPFPRTEEDMKNELSSLAKELITYCHSVLVGDLTDLQQIELKREAWNLEAEADF